MNINGPLFPPGTFPAGALTGTRPARPSAANATGDASNPSPASAAPPQAAAGLWDVLTEEERAFFAEQAAIGPLTYGPGRTSSGPAPAPTGQRVDRTG
jgi:hypothetical protein